MLRVLVWNGRAAEPAPSKRGAQVGARPGAPDSGGISRATDAPERAVREYAKASVRGRLRGDGAPLEAEGLAEVREGVANS